MSNIRYLSAVIAVCFLTVFCVISAPKTINAQDDLKATTCEQKAALINYRSKLLSAYKTSEEKQSKVFRKKWADRVTYAGQWVPKESKKARDAIYNYDKLHKALIDEVDKQIKEFQYLEIDPVDCSEAKKNTFAVKLEELRGRDGKRITGGQALIEKLKKEETKYTNGKFEKVTNKMIKKLHAAKDKNPRAEKSMTVVKEP